MSWRTVVVSQRAKLDLQLGYLVVRGETTTQIHLSEISILVIENTAVSLTAALLSELSEQKIKVIFCDNKRNPYGELVPYYGSHDSSGKIRTQITWSNDTKENVWTAIVKEKIRKQYQFLKECGLTQANMLENYYHQVQLGDISNREGHAAKVYFNAIFGIEFTRQSDTPTNASLNYGYSILCACFSREITSCGYLTQLGLFHDNQFNYFNLASDLMEPFRTLVDRVVAGMDLSEFGKENKLKILKMLDDTIIIFGKEQTVKNAIKLYCKNTLNCISENRIDDIAFYENIN